MNLEQVDLKIQCLHDNGARYAKRGFKLSDASPYVATNHMLEEAVELQAELINGTRKSQIEEAADLICVYLHALYMAGIPITAVLVRADQNLDEKFTYDEPQTVGFTRRARKEQPNAR